MTVTALVIGPILLGFILYALPKGADGFARGSYARESRFGGLGDASLEFGDGHVFSSNEIKTVSSRALA